MPYAKEITSYNYDCIKAMAEPDECLEKKNLPTQKKK